MFLKIKILIFICREDEEDMINDQKQKFLQKKSRELKLINDRSPLIDATQTETQTENYNKTRMVLQKSDFSFLISYLFN